MRRVLYPIGFLFVDDIGIGCNLYLFTVHNVLLDEQLTRAPTPIHYRLHSIPCINEHIVSKHEEISSFSHSKIG